MTDFADFLRAALAVYALTGVVVLASTCGGEARAQGVSPAIIHARACVGELGWRAPDEACVAIVGVHRRRSALTGASPEQVARVYSRALRSPPSPRRWVRQLHDRPTAPAAWPIGPSWAAARARFAQIVDVAREALSGTRPEACPGAVHYGGLMDGTPSGHEEACRWRVGRGAQVFYRRAGEVSGPS